MNCLITGANGFIGSELLKFFKQKNLSVKPMYRKNTENIQGCAIADVTKVDSLIDAFKGVDLVIHSAGITYGSSKLMYEVNVQGTKNVISACIKNKVQKLIHISSTAAIGASYQPLVLNEEAKFNMKEFPYFNSKYLSEKLVLESKNILEVVILNPTQVYGPRDMLKLSRKSLQLKVMKGELPFYSKGGVSIVDIFSVTKATYNSINDGVNGQRYILCGENLYLKKMFELLSKISNSKKPSIQLPNGLLLSVGKLEKFFKFLKLSPPISYERAKLATMFHWFDSKKAKERLNFRPKPAQESLSLSVEWAKDNLLRSKNSF